MASRLFLLGLVAAVVADEGDDCSLTDRQPKRVSSHKNTATVDARTDSTLSTLSNVVSGGLQHIFHQFTRLCASSCFRPLPRASTGSLLEILPGLQHERMLYPWPRP